MKKKGPRREAQAMSATTLSLIPCPSCGEMPAQERYLKYVSGKNKTYGFWVRCENPKCPMDTVEIDGCETEEEVVQRWNRRWKMPPPPVLRKMFQKQKG